MVLQILKKSSRLTAMHITCSWAILYRLNSQLPILENTFFM
jgi:hypothetical protein